MSTVDEILEDLSARGIELWVEADRLRFRAPEGALTADLREMLTASRQQLIIALRKNAEARETAFPLSYNQHALFFLHQNAPDSPAYNVGVAIRIRSAVDPAAMRNATQALVDRHEILRTTYEQRGDEPVQVIRGAIEAPFTAVDAAQDSESELSARVHAASRSPFDLKTGPIIRLHLFTVSALDHVLLVSAHHIAVDGWSYWMLLDELRTLYAAHATGKRATLPRSAANYLDFVRDQQQLIEDFRGESAWDYWSEQLKGDLTPLELPTDRPRPPTMRYVGSSVEVSIPESLVSSVKRLAREQGTTTFTVLLSALNVVLSRCTGRTDVIVGTPVFGRSQEKFQTVVGDFVNSVALRSEVSGDRTFNELLRDAGATVRDAIKHGEYPFPVLVQRLGIRRDPSRTPVFQVMLVLQKPQRSSDLTVLFTPGTGSIDFAGLKVEGFPLAYQEGQVDLTLELGETETSLVGALKYNTDVFEESTVRRISGYFTRLLAAAVAQPDSRIDALSSTMLTEAERDQVLVGWNATALPVADESPLAGFERNAATRPAAVAIEASDGRLTYAELEARANQLAQWLTRSGVGPGVLVGIGLTRTMQLPIAVLAVLKAGGAYVPLDPGFPAQRLTWMLEDAAPAVLVTERALASVWPDSSATVVCVDDPAAALTAEPTTAVPATAGAEDLAYVIFTSGSTGRPKGVEIPRRAVTNFLTSMAETPGCRAGDRLLAVTTLSFDIAVLELLLPLATGGTVVLATREEASDGARLRALLEERQITQMQATPATWRMLREAGWSGTPGLTVLCGGEALPGDLAEALVARVGAVWNMYGPTETTVWSTVGRVRAGARVTIGRPIGNTRVYVLGPERQPVPVGVTGELWIGGAGLARGYFGQPGLTAERFVADPFVAGSRMYRTGDLTRWTAAGELEHLGRVDAQVKVRGFRIELGEVETAILALPDVRQAAAVAVTGEGGDTRLIGCVVPVAGATVDSSAMRQALRGRLPEYMVPSAIVAVERLPQTANGKLDRLKLAAEADQTARGARVTVAEPLATATEQRLAAIWCELLGVSYVGRHDDFFMLGGHSLLATRLISHVRDAFMTELPMAAVFSHPVLSGLAAYIDGLSTVIAVSPAPTDFLGEDREELEF